MTESSKGVEGFLKVFARYGGALRYSELDELASARFGELLTWYGAALKNARYAKWPHLSMGALHTGFVHNPSFNAIATSDGDQELVGVFSGAVNLIYEHFQCFLADPGVLPAVGDLAGESPPPSLDVLRSRGAVHATHRNYPRDEMRLRAAFHLSLNAALFLLFHELAHVARGHLALLRDDFTIVEYTEFPPTPLPLGEAEARRALELDADEGAAASSFHIWKALYLNKAFPALESVGLEVSWSMSISMLFRIMTGRSFPTSDSTIATHPTPDARWIHILYCASEAGLSFPASIEVQKLALGVSEVQGWWERNDLPSGPERASHEIHPELELLRGTLAGIAPRLRAYALERSEKIEKEMESDLLS